MSAVAAVEFVFSHDCLPCFRWFRRRAASTTISEPTALIDAHDAADHQRLPAGLLDRGHGDLHAEADQAEGEEPGDQVAEHGDLLRRVAHRAVRLDQHVVAVLGQDLGVDHAAQRVVVVDRHDLLVLDQACSAAFWSSRWTLSASACRVARSLSSEQLAADLAFLVGLDHRLGFAVVEELALVVLGRREDAGRGQREHQDEAQHEHRELADDHLRRGRPSARRSARASRTTPPATAR